MMGVSLPLFMENSAGIGFWLGQRDVLESKEMFSFIFAAVTIIVPRNFKEELAGFCLEEIDAQV